MPHARARAHIGRGAAGVSASPRLRVIVTAASSELGEALLRALTARARLRFAGHAAVPVERILAVDRVQRPELFVDERIDYVRGDYEQPRFLARMMGAATFSVFHLSAIEAAAGVEPGGAGLEIALARSFGATHSLLDACRGLPRPPRLVFAGRRGVREAGATVPRDTAAMCADICESVLVEAARRGLIELRCVRLPPAPAALETCAAGLIEAHEIEGVKGPFLILESEDDGRLRPVN